MSDPWDEALAAGRRAYRMAYRDSIQGAMLTELAMEAALAAFRDAIADRIDRDHDWNLQEWRNHGSRTLPGYGSWYRERAHVLGRTAERIGSLGQEKTDD